MPNERSPQDKASEYADYYLGNQDFQSALRGVINLACQYLAGHLPAGQASQRRSEFQRASSHAKGLRQLLSRIDHPAIAAAMRPITPKPPGSKLQPKSESGQGVTAGSSLSLRLVEVAYAMDVLERLADGLAVAASREEPARHRPSTRDPIIFAVEALAALWMETRKELPTASFNGKRFGDFALAVLGSRGLGCAEATVCTAVRYVIKALKESQTGNPSLQPG